MPTWIFLGVLFGAFLHASWNAIIKAGTNKTFEVALVCSFAALISAALLPFFPAPARESWPYMAGSLAMQYTYYSLLAAAYRTGDMSAVYPLMRGTAPLLVATIGALWLGEQLGGLGWLAVIAICAGILSLIFGGGEKAPGHGPALRVALANAGVIAAYTMFDGIGVRKSGSPIAYTLWVFALTGIIVAVPVIARHRQAFVEYSRKRAGIAIFGGVATTTSYGLALYAMTQAPIALVAALRETSILFAVALSVLMLRERMGWVRYLAGALIAAGAVSIRLA